MRRVALLMLSLVVAGAAEAQSVRASVDRDRVEIDDEVTVEVHIEGGRGRNVQPPKATCCLQLVSPRPAFDATTSVNGETERTLAWRYRATRPGGARVLPTTVEVGGQTLRTGPVDVEVVPPAPMPTLPDLPAGDLFVRAEPSRTSAVVGQQVLVDYVLYFDDRLQPRQTTPTGTWDAPGTWREELDVPPAYPRAVQRGGRALESVVIRRLALFPTRDGPLELAPMDFSIDLFRASRIDRSDPFAPFFQPFRSTFEKEDVTAPAVTIDVAPLPDGAPPSFAGAVGQFGIATEVAPQQVAAGEPIQLSVTLSGTGNLATLAAPTLDAPSGVDVYDPQAETDLSRSAEPLRGRKTFTWTLVPQGGGTLEVPPVVWSYYDPADGRYKTLRSDAAEIAVAGPALAATAPSGATGLMTAADWQAAPGPVGWLWVVLGGGLALPLLALAGFAAVRAGRERAAADTPERRRKRAAPEVRRRLAAARSVDGPEGYAAVDAAIRRFLADRLNVPATVRSRPALRAALDTRGISPDLQARLDALLADAERGQFAPGPAPSRAALLDDAERVLDALASATTPTRRRRRGDAAR